MIQIDSFIPIEMLWLICVVFIIACMIYVNMTFTKIRTFREVNQHIMHINNNYVRIHPESLMFKMNSDTVTPISKPEALSMLRNRTGTLVIAYGQLYLYLAFSDGECYQGVWSPIGNNNVASKSLTYFTPTEQEYIIRWILTIFD